MQTSSASASTAAPASRSGAGARLAASGAACGCAPLGGPSPAPVLHWGIGRAGSGSGLALWENEDWQMIIDPAEGRGAAPNGSVTEWLLDSDPSIRWQVMRDLVGAPEKEMAAERARVATEGVGARLLDMQGTDGLWAGTAWNRGWNSTMHALMLLRELGLDPASEPARRAVDLVRDNVTWRGAGPQ